MRQITFGEQWIHPETPEIIRDIFKRHGVLKRFKKGAHMLHGGPHGEISLVLRGVCLYQFTDWLNKEHIFSVVIPRRTVGDVDAASCQIANISAIVAKDVDALVLPYNIWHHEITSSVEVLEAFTTNLVLKQESHIEALLACFTMDVEMRLKAFFHSLIRAYYLPKANDWNPLPITLNTVIIAKIISASRTSVSLTLSDWQKRGLLRRDGKMLLLHGLAFTEVLDWWSNRANEKKSQSVYTLTPSRAPCSQNLEASSILSIPS